MKQTALGLLLLLAAAPGGEDEAVLAAEQAKETAALGALRGSAKPARVARAYGRILRPDCVDPLLGLLESKDAGVRRETLFAMGQFGWKAEFSAGREQEMLTAIAPSLKIADETVRVAAVEAAGKLAMAKAPETLAPFLKDASGAVRAEAVVALFRARLVQRMRGVKPADIPDLPKAVFEALVALAGDDEDLVRRNVAYYFYRVKDVRGLETAAKLATDKQLWTRVYGVGAVGRQADPKAVPPVLMAATADGEYLVRLVAVQSLAALNAGDRIPAKLADDPSYHVRAALADATTDDRLLDALWKDKSVAVQASALKSIANKRKGAASALVVGALKHENWLIREAGVEAAASLEKETEALVTPLLQDKDERVVAKAVDVVSKLETKSAYEAVKAALASDLLYVRATAVESLGGRKEADVYEVAWACYEACANRKWVEVRESIVDLFAATPNDESTRRLRMLARDASTSVANKARRVLVDRGATDLPPARVEERAANPHQKLRFAANPVVVLETTRGTMEIECYASEAPIHVANFVGLVKAGTYDGLPWHRIVPAFVIQGGDPYGTGMGDAGWPLRAEMNAVRYDRGTLGMPRSDGFDTGGCQLFFTHLPTPHLDGQYTVFGKITSGVDVMDAIERGDKIIKATVK